MRAVALRQYLPVTDPSCLVDVDLPDPVPQGREVLVRVEAVSVNPIDTKQRSPLGREGLVEDPPKVLGFDAAGTVVAVGPSCTTFGPGDAVWYAGVLGRQGSNAELQCVDERIVGRRPRTLDAAAAAAMPLTTLTAWESLFERLALVPDGGSRGRTLLVVGGAGGVGSMAVQLGRWSGATVVATASRPESAAWVRDLGADHVVDWRDGLPAGLASVGVAAADAVFCTQRPDPYWEQMAEVAAPLGRVCLIVDAAGPLPITAYKPKSLTVAWESMFTRALFGTPDMAEQHHILTRAARLVDEGVLRSTHAVTLGPISAAAMREAHAAIESGTTVGKIVLSGW